MVSADKGINNLGTAMWLDYQKGPVVTPAVPNPPGAVNLVQTANTISNASEPRTIARVGGRAYSGVTCSNCSTTYDKCMGTRATNDQACCSLCSTKNNHRPTRMMT